MTQGRLTDNLLCIAQLESGEIRLKPTTVDFSAVLRQVISRFVEVADRGRFLVHIDESLGYLHVDEERLALVLACLIDNALKFAPDNEAVEITAVRVVNKAHVEVRDNGRRIPDGEVERVFASFYQVENPVAAPARWLRRRPLPRPPAGRAHGRTDLARQQERARQFLLHRGPPRGTVVITVPGLPVTDVPEP